MSTATNNTNHYEAIAEKFLNGTITPDEETILFNWYNSQQDAPVEIPVAFAKNSHLLKKRIWQKIEQQKTGRKTSVLLSFLSVRNVAAAILLTLIGATTFYLLQNNSPAESSVAINNLPKSTEILPGGNKATLTLANGEIVTLDDANNGKISSQGNSNVVKLKSGLLAYQQSVTSVPEPIAAINILSTPKGGQYQVKLPDGTMVWLNASSSLKYPTFFSGKERVVELTGEGYFEVAKNKDMPFKVKVKDMEVAVLGTHFNVMAYTDESTVNTTLLEGSVKIHTPQVSKIITPGEQAQLSANGKMSITNADLEETVAWKNGYFQFASANMQTVIRQVKRWYDADIIYSGNIEEHFTGTISRSVDAEKVLKKLQLTGAFKFEIKNKQIFITK